MPSETLIDTEEVSRQLLDAHAVLGLDVDELHADADDVADLGHTNEAVDDLDHEGEVPADHILENIASALREFDGSSELEVEGTGAWKKYQRLIPSPARDLLSSCIRRDFVRDVVLDRLHQDVLLRRLDPDLLDAVSVRDAWRDACSQEKLHGTLRLIRHTRDRVVRVLHKTSAYQHFTYTTLPGYLKTWKPVNGVLQVIETGKTIPSIGWSAYLEATPPQLVRYVYETWLASKLGTSDDMESLGKAPMVLAPTGGAGTEFDLLSLLGCRVVSTDLTSMNEAVGTLDARRFKNLFSLRPAMTEKDKKQRRVPRPDIVMFDPGSRGTPAHSEIYDHVEGEPDPRDFAVLSRQDWIDTTTSIVKELLPFLAVGGVVSFLVRCGVRDRGRFEPDPELVQDVKAALGTDVKVIEEVTIEYGKNRVKQASLAQARVPAVHLLLGRPA